MIFDERKYFAAFAVAFSVFSACSVYDNYDPDLMPGAVASIESSEDASSSSVSSEAESSSSEEEISSSSEEVSSSSEEISSSSEEEVSSSSEAPKSSGSDWTCGDTLRHDGYVYKTAYIEDKDICLIAENMRTTVNKKFGKTMCYHPDGSENVDDDSTNCEKYGLLYDHEAAMNACPSGWRLPTKDEVDMLVNYIETDNEDVYQEAGAYFKAQEGWEAEEGESGNGNDFYHFAGLPGGWCDSEGICDGIGTMGLWWTSSRKKTNSDDFFYFALYDASQAIDFTADLPETFYSVRCFRNMK